MSNTAKIEKRVLPSGPPIRPPRPKESELLSAKLNTDSKIKETASLCLFRLKLGEIPKRVQELQQYKEILQDVKFELTLCDETMKRIMSVLGPATARSENSHSREELDYVGYEVEALHFVQKQNLPRIVKEQKNWVDPANPITYLNTTEVKEANENPTTYPPHSLPPSYFTQTTPLTCANGSYVHQSQLYQSFPMPTPGPFMYGSNPCFQPPQQYPSYNTPFYSYPSGNSPLVPSYSHNFGSPPSMPIYFNTDQNMHGFQRHYGNYIPRQ